MNQDVTELKSWLGTGSINLFGEPFSGKDTQGKILAELLGAEFVSGGEILRARQDLPEVQRVMAEGSVIPSDVYVDVVLPYLAQPSLKDKPLLLSSVGRAHGEEASVMQATEAAHHPLMAVLFLTLDEQEVWKRFEALEQQGDRGGRRDDSRETVKKRLRVFQEETMPVIKFYREKNLLIEVNGAGSRDEVTQSIVSALAAFSQ